MRGGSLESSCKGASNLNLFLYRIGLDKETSCVNIAVRLPDRHSLLSFHFHQP